MPQFNYPIGRGNQPKPSAKPAAKPMAAEPDGDEPMGGDVTPEIHQHLQAMHSATGEAHTHVEHHDDGSHTSHHVNKAGEVHGPHDHANLEELKSAMDQFIGEEEHEPSEGGEKEY